MPWVSRRKPSTLSSSFQLLGAPGLAWWDSSSPLPCIVMVATEDKIGRGSPVALAVSFLDGSDPSWQMPLPDSSQLLSLFYCSSPFLRFQGMRGTEITNCIGECHKGTGCSGHGSSTEEYNLKRETHAGSACTNSNCGMVIRDQCRRDPQTLKLFRIAFVSCSDLDCFIP